jgi:hypothetical protein
MIRTVVAIIKCSKFSSYKETAVFPIASFSNKLNVMSHVSAYVATFKPKFKKAVKWSP